MSSYLNKYIEVKKNGKWHLVKWNVLDDNCNVKTESELSRGLVLRDEVNWHKPGWDGLPKDITPELKQIIDGLNASLSQSGWTSGYHFSWATLTEFKKLLEDDTKTFVEVLRKNIKKEQDTEILENIKEIKALVQGKTYKKKKKSAEDEEFDYYDSTEFNLDIDGYESSTIGHLLSLQDAISELETLAYLYIGDDWRFKYTTDDIRIIYYFA